MSRKNFEITAVGRAPRNISDINFFFRLYPSHLKRIVYTRETTEKIISTKKNIFLAKGKCAKIKLGFLNYC